MITFESWTILCIIGAVFSGFAVGFLAGLIVKDIFNGSKNILH